MERPFTQSDARFEQSLGHLRSALHPQPERSSFDIMKDEIGDVLGQRPVGSALRSAQDRFNELGTDGWELISFFPDSGNFVAIFKRSYE